MGQQRGWEGDLILQTGIKKKKKKISIDGKTDDPLGEGCFECCRWQGRFQEGAPKMDTKSITNKLIFRPP